MLQEPQHRRWDTWCRSEIDSAQALFEGQLGTRGEAVIDARPEVRQGETLRWAWHWEDLGPKLGRH